MRTQRMILFMASVCLLALGIVMVYEVTGIRALEAFGDSFYYVKKQLFFIFLGLIFSLFILSVDYRYLQKHARWFFVLAVVMLALVLVPHISPKIGGARRWFRLGAFNFQPSEFAKLALIIYLSDLLSRKGARINLFWKGFVPAMAVLGTSVLLVLLEPDLGTAVVMSGLGLVLLFLAGIRLRYLLSLFICAVPSLFFLIVLKPYRFRRIVAFINPWADRLGAGHQIIQSIIAIASGGLFGTGLGHSLQKLYYLPAAHTDFIFSIIAEEFGLIGAAAVLGLFGAIFFAGFKIALKIKDVFGRFLCAGLLSLMAFEVVIHIGVTTACLPTKGLPLPFVSYGGTNLLFNMINIALLLNLSKNGT
ncbi:MAG: putative lipid II flippase FtsW [Candidatus Omnitrophota bacterium]